MGSRAEARATEEDVTRYPVRCFQPSTRGWLCTSFGACYTQLLAHLKLPCRQAVNCTNARSAV